MTQSTDLTRDDIARTLREVVLEILPGTPPEEVTGRRHLRDLGADSVDRIEIILGVQDRLGLHTQMSRFGDLPHIDAMVDLLCEVSRS